MSYSYFLYSLNIIESNAITVWKFVDCPSKMFRQLLTEASQKVLTCWLPYQSLKNLFSENILGMEGMDAIFD